MSKPDDIPQSVLAVAEEAYQQAIYMTTSDEPQNMVLMVARAIMAERERCAGVAMGFAKQFPEYPEFDEAHNCGVAIVDAIRSSSP